MFQVLWFINYFWEVRSGYLLEAKRYMYLVKMANMNEPANEHQRVAIILAKGLLRQATQGN